MGGSSTKPNKEDEVSSHYKKKSNTSDESFHIIAEKFGYYDSTDSDISELQFPLDHRNRSSQGDSSYKTGSGGESGPDGLKGKINSLEGKGDNSENTEFEDLEPTSLYDIAGNTYTKGKKLEILLGAPSSPFGRGPYQTSSTEVSDAKSKSDESKSSSQMSIECKRTGLERHPTRYSREPPERDRSFSNCFISYVIY